MPIKFKNIRLRSKAFPKNEDGATAIEFALVALPFFALIFAIVELAIIFFVNSALSNAVSEAGRIIRVGQFQNCGEADRFKELVCENMFGVGECESNLVINVITEPTFKTIVVPDTNIDTSDPNNLDADGNLIIDPITGQPPLPDDSFPVGGDINSSTPVVVKGTYYYRLALPTQLTRLESTPGTGIRTISATTAFRTEPFPDTGSCGIT